MKIIFFRVGWDSSKGDLKGRNKAKLIKKKAAAKKMPAAQKKEADSLIYFSNVSWGTWYPQCPQPLNLCSSKLQTGPM